MAMLPLTHLAQVSMATNHRTHLASWAPKLCAWYPDAKAARLAQGIFLLMDLPHSWIYHVDVLYVVDILSHVE